jgi:AcrR family transcriptional regulator
MDAEEDAESMAAAASSGRRQSSFTRARSAEHKQQRREAILTAAHDLALREGVQGVTLAAVARAVGLAKSNVLRYFGTREEVYLELMAEQWREWADELATRMPASPTSTAALAAALCDSLASRPLFCDLQSVLATSLERHVGLESASRYKTAALASVERAGIVIADHTGLEPGEGFELAAAATVFAGMIWPMAHPPAVLRELYRAEPELARACPPFGPTLERLIHVLAEGLPATRPAPSRPATGPPASGDTGAAC